VWYTVKYVHFTSKCTNWRCVWRPSSSVFTGKPSRPIDWIRGETTEGIERGKEGRLQRELRKKKEGEEENGAVWKNPLHCETLCIPYLFKYLSISSTVLHNIQKVTSFWTTRAHKAALISNFSTIMWTSKSTRPQSQDQSVVLWACSSQRFRQCHIILVYYGGTVCVNNVPRVLIR